LETVSVKLHESDIVCPNPKCGKVFEEPLLLRDLSKKPAEMYYVCPHCIIKLDKMPIQDEEGSSPVPVEPAQRLEETESGPCSHHFGYLKTLPKGASLPDDCLTCPELLRCSLKK